MLGRSYAHCIERVYDHGGEFLHLMGDALLAYWPGDVDGLGCAVRAANACAAEICNDRGDPLATSSAESGPAFHIGIGAGNLWATALGGQPLWNLVVGGEAVVEAANAQREAHRWECKLSPTARCELAKSAREQPKSQLGRAKNELDDEWLAGFVPQELREAVWNADANGPTGNGSAENLGSDRTAASLECLAEIRPITALFARFVGLDPHDPQALERHQALCAALQVDLRSRGAPSGDLIYDDKGLTFVTVLGSRGSFHRDDPSRAVDAACALVESAKGLQLLASVGIATGDAIFRVIGNVHRCQLMVLGKPMNRAARLMTSTSTGILCDAPTERVSRASFLFEPRGTLQLIGLGDTAAVFRPLKRRPIIAPAVSLIGRRTELKVLMSVDKAALGHSGIVIVLGEPGMGKTALVRAFAEELRSDAISLFEASAEREDRRTSLSPWRRAIASLLNLATDVDGSTLLESAAARFKGNSSILRRLPLLDGLLSIEIDQNESTRHLEGRHRADATMRLLADIIQALAPRPLVIALDDSQWFDSASWRLAEWLLASMSSLLLIACVRSEEVPDELKSLQSRIGDGRKIGEAGTHDHVNFCHVLNLEELNEGSISDIVSRFR